MEQAPLFTPTRRHLRQTPNDSKPHPSHGAPCKTWSMDPGTSLGAMIQRGVSSRSDRALDSRDHAGGKPMKKIEITAYGAPGAGEIVFDVLAFPINPADLSMIRGNYRLKPPLPATPGAECIGRVAAVGTGVGLKAGDLVINMQRENWVQRRRITAADAVAIPPGLDLAQAAMLRINPATAQLLLEDHVALAPGDWVIQNVANSAVGRHLIVLARARGIRTVNVVRRDDVAPPLRALGADAVLADGPDLAERAGAATNGAPIRLGIDAVSGGATKRIADCVGDGA